jgi:glycosyltransferase involved in cell wall biosynthesis
MRITIITGPFQPLPPGPAGAVEKLWLDLAHEFAVRGHRVTMLSKEEEGEPTISGGAAEVVRIGVPGFRRSRSLAVNLARDFVYSLRAAAAVPPSDIVVTNAFWAPVLLAWRRRTGMHIVVSVERMPKGQMWLYSSVSRLRAPSHAVAEAIQRQAPWLARKVKVIPNPVDLSCFRPTERTGGDPAVVLYAGRIHPEKGLDLLVEAVNLLAHWGRAPTLRLIGPVQVSQGGAGPAYAKRLIEKARDVPVELLDPVFDRRKLCEEYHKATCFCYPSVAERGESFPVAPLEAMAAGLVPVVSALRCFGEYVTDGQTGLVFDHRAPDRVQRLAGALEAVLLNERLRARMRAAGVVRARDFSTARIADRLLEDFQLLSS